MNVLKKNYFPHFISSWSKMKRRKVVKLPQTNLSFETTCSLFKFRDVNGGVHEFYV